MKINLKVLLSVVVVMLFVLSLTGYAHGRHDESGEIRANISLENPSPVSTEDSLVSRWLEARLAEELLIHEAGGGEYTFGAAWIQDECFGGGWCNQCGCWLRHGCDPNGNCTNGHYSNCGPGLGCPLHEGDCVSSAGG
jgi:hypothetical protein